MPDRDVLLIVWNRRYHDILQAYGPLDAGLARRYATTPEDVDPV